MSEGVIPSCLFPFLELSKTSEQLGCSEPCLMVDKASNLILLPVLFHY
jgi:hypothetical protein